MHVTLLLPGALLPHEVVGALAEPLARTGLATVLARADPGGDTETEPPAHVAWLAEHLFRRPSPLATAPYAYAALSGRAPPPGDVLWQADPVHLELARDHLALTPLPSPPSADDARALIASANALLNDHGAAFFTQSDRWFLRSPRDWDVQALPLAAVIGRPLQTALPRGADAPMWNRLLTEIQMTWHADPLNDAREARGEPTVNSVWLHGGGRWSALPPSSYTKVLADAPEWRGAAAAAGTATAVAHEPPIDGALLVWSELLAPRLLHDWDAWLGAVTAVSTRLSGLARTAVLDLVLTGGHTVRRLQARPTDRLRFWRGRTLEQALSA